MMERGTPPNIKTYYKGGAIETQMDRSVKSEFIVHKHTYGNLESGKGCNSNEQGENGLVNKY